MGLDTYLLKLPQNREENIIWSKNKDKERLVITESYIDYFTNLTIDEPQAFYAYSKVFEEFSLYENDYNWITQTDSFISFYKGEFPETQYWEEIYPEICRKTDVLVKGETFLSGNIFVIYYEKCPVEIKIEKVIYTQHLGYQRKGANQLFYKENIWGKDIIIYKLNDLLDYWYKYFSGEKNIPDELKDADDHGYQVEYNYSSEISKRNFKENIIDKFVEDKTVVIFR